MVSMDQLSGGHSGELSGDDQLRQYEFLYGEMQAFGDYSRTGLDNAQVIEGFAVLLRALRAELQGLRHLLEESSADETAQAGLRHHLNSSNLSYWNALWSIAKGCRGITAFNRRFNPQTPQSRGQPKPKVVDIICDNGRRWVKVSTMSERRLLFDMAKLGWNADDSEDDEMLDADDDENDSLPLFKMASNLSRASRATWAGDRVPEVTFVLTRIREGSVPQIDKVLDNIRNLPGMQLVLLHSADPTSILLKDALPTMTVDPFGGLSDVLNMDCTVLLSLSSDLSHVPVSSSIWRSNQTKTQMEQEAKEPILSTWIYPALGDRHLVCTEKCAEHFMKIVKEIGTESEQRRAALVVGGAETSSRQDWLERWSALSDHKVPGGLQLPVRIVASNPQVQELATGSKPNKFPQQLADAISTSLSELNRDIFMYGWKTGRTTITSNYTTARRIMDLIHKHHKFEEQDVIGPQIWMRAPSRSLIAKEKSSVRGVNCPPGKRASDTSYEPVAAHVY